MGETDGLVRVAEFSTIAIIIVVVLLILLLIGCTVGIICYNKKRTEAKQTYDVQSSVSSSRPANGYTLVSQPSQPPNDYISFQRQLDKSFARIKELEDRIDMETNEECRTYYNLQDGLDKASSRLDVIEYTINSKQSGAASAGAPVRRQESVFSRSSRGTTNASFRYTDMNQGQGSRTGQPTHSYLTPTSSNYDRQTFYPQSARSDW